MNKIVYILIFFSLLGCGGGTEKTEIISNSLDAGKPLSKTDICIEKAHNKNKWNLQFICKSLRNRIDKLTCKIDINNQLECDLKKCGIENAVCQE